MIVGDKQGLEVDSEVRRMLALSRASSSDHVAVAGPHSLEVVVELCRSGYEHVICTGGRRCSCAGETNSLLLIPGPSLDGELSTVIDSNAALLADGGAVVVHLTDIDQDRLVESCLASHGLEVRSTVFNLTHDVLVVHRVGRQGHHAEAA